MTTAKRSLSDRPGPDAGDHIIYRPGERVHSADVHRLPWYFTDDDGNAIGEIWFSDVEEARPS